MSQLAVVVTMILAMAAVGALSMPTTIDSGYYSCVGPSTECTVPALKTTLNVQNMINDAVGVGNTSATFIAVRPTFLGIIDINAPTAAVAALPLHVLVEDGYGYNIVTPSTDSYMIIRGRLAPYSTIIIMGGNYSEVTGVNVHFIRIPFSIEITGGSSILVSNVCVTGMRILSSVTSAAVTLSGGSSISIVDSTASYSLSPVYIGALTLTGGSSWSVTNSTLSVSGSTNEAFWLNKATFISGTGSALIFSNNTLFYTMGGSGTTNTESGIKFESTLSISMGGRVQASHNTLTAQGTASLDFALVVGATSLSDDGGIEMEGNSVHVNTTASGILALFYFNAAVSISGSSMNVISNNVTHIGVTCLPLFFVSTLSLSSLGAVLVTNNTLSLNSQYVAIFYVVGVILVDSGSSVSVVSNTFHVTIDDTATAATSAVVVYAGANVYVAHSGVFSIHANTITIGIRNTHSGGSVSIVSCASTIDISHGAGLHIVDNNMQTSINASGSATLRLLETLYFNVVDSSTLNVSHNNVDAILYSELSQAESSLIYIIGTTTRVFVHNYSAVTLGYNVVVLDILANAAGRSGVWLGSVADFSMGNASAFRVVGNTISATQRNNAEIFGVLLTSVEASSNSILLLKSSNVSVLFENATKPAFRFLRTVTLTVSNSTIEVSHHQVTLQAVAPSTSAVSGTTTIVTAIVTWVLNYGFEVVQGGLFHIHDNTLASSGNCTLLVASVISVSTEGSVLLNESSSIVIRRNTMEASWGTSLLLYISVSGIGVPKPTTITGGSTIYLQDNYFPRVVGNTASPYIHLCGLFSPAYLGGNSSIHITNNTVTNDKGIARIFETSLGYPVTLDDVHIIIEGNVVKSMGVADSMAGWEMVSTYGNVTQYFRLLFTDNVITISMSGEGTDASGFMFVITADVNTNYPPITEPLFTIQGNTVTGIGNNQTRGGYGCFIVFLYAGETVGDIITPSEFPIVEIARVVNNSITTTNFNMTDIMRVNFTSHVEPYRVALTNNTVSSDEESVSRLATISLSNATSLLTLSTCGNTINNHMCHEAAQGTHSCVAYNPSQVFINDCKTSTLSPSYTPSLSSPASRTSTPTPTNSQHPTLSDPLSTSQTHVPTATAPPTPTTTHPPTPSTSVSLPTTATVHRQSTTPTTTSTPTATTSRPKSASQTPSQTAIDTATPSISTTGATASRCGLGDSSTFYPLCSVLTAIGLSREALNANKTSSVPCVSNVTTTTTTSPPLTISVPFNVWGGGTTSPIRLYFKIGAHFGSSIIPRGGSDSPPSSTIQSDNGDAESAVSTATKGEDDFPVISVNVWYTGLPTLARVVDTIRLPTHTIVRCPINTSGVPYVPSSFDGGGVLGGDEYPMTASIQIGIRVQLEAAEPPLPILEPTITTTVVVAVVGSVISGMPSGLVRGGMVSSLQGMMRCSEFDPEDEVDRINNPPMLAVGSSGMDTLQYQRGSVVIGLAVVGAATVILLLSAVFQVVVLGNMRTVGAGMTMLRMPSSILPIALLVGEMSSGSATTMLLYRSNDSSNQLPTSSIAADALLAIVVLCCTWSVFIYYAYSSTVGCQVVAAPIDFNMHNNDDSQHHLDGTQQQVDEHTVYTTDGINDSFIALPDSDDDNIMLSNNSITQIEKARRRAQLGSFQRLVCFLLEPTHEPSLPLLPAHIKNTDNNSSREGTPTTPTPPRTIRIEELEVWLQRHYFFVAERRWIAYGAAEALLGSLVDIIEGIPVTSRSLAACAFPPATMAIMLIVLLTLLLWKWPFAVRIQQWGSMAVVGLLSLVSTLVTINIFIASVELEEVCGYFLLISSILITIFSVLDIIAWLLMLLPCLREKLGLRPVSLSTALARLRKDAHVPPAMRTEEMATLFIPTHDHHSDDDNPPTTTQNNEADFYRVAFQVLAHRLRKPHPNQ